MVEMKKMTMERLDEICSRMGGNVSPEDKAGILRAVNYAVDSIKKQQAEFKEKYGDDWEAHWRESKRREFGL